MQQSNLVDFSFGMQNPNEVDGEIQFHCFRINSSAYISSEEEDDIDKKMRQLYSKTKQALQSIDQREIQKKVKYQKNQSVVSSKLVCSKSLPQVQLCFINKMFTHDHKGKGFSSILNTQSKEQIDKQDIELKNQKCKSKQKIKYTSYFSIPNRNLCYSYINN